MNDIFDELALSNYWNGKLPKVEFARKSYTNRIFGYVGNRLVKVLTGQRGVGKGCLLRQIIYQLIADGVSSRNILYISKKFTDSGVLSGYRDASCLSVVPTRICFRVKPRSFWPDITSVLRYFPLAFPSTGYWRG